MLKISEDIGGTWYYTEEPKKQYICLDNNGNIVGKLYPEYVPDPLELWKTKCEAAGIKMTDIGAEQLKSNQVVYDIWEHCNANANN